MPIENTRKERSGQRIWRNTSGGLLAGLRLTVSSLAKALGCHAELSMVLRASP
jgi:hypothetical protein